MRIALLLTLFAVVGFAEEGKDPRVMEEGKAPTPFTAEQIRWASPEGRVCLMKMKNPQGNFLVRFSFGKGDAKQTTFETAGMTLEKQELGPPRSRTVTWTELQGHASYDEDKTTISEEQKTVGAGKFDCWLYSVKVGEETHRFWFAKVLPGPPVMLEVESEGKITQTMEMIEQRCFDYEKVFGKPQPGEKLASPIGWTVEASVVAAGDDGSLRLRASLSGPKKAKTASLRVASGPLTGAILPLAWDEKAKKLVCNTLLPKDFRMKTGKLWAAIRDVGGSE
ncbi:MAG: hypothetical protein ACYTHK_18425 [Planctomycetota bacterium]|jgi:hypothetical protein